MQRRVTSGDVAAEAGVSRATVSYVLNGRTEMAISKPTREAVFAAARRLGYQPSPAARALRSGRSDLVVVLVPYLSESPELTRMMSGIGQHLGKAGLACVRYEGGQWHGRLQTLWQRVSAAAVVTWEPLAPADADATLNAGVVEVACSAVDRVGRARTMQLDQVEIGAVQARHLLERGHRRLLYVHPDDPREKDFYEARVQGFESAVAAVATASSEVLALPLDPAASLEHAVARLAESPFEAVGAFSDVTALCVLAAARQRGMRVPQDLAVIGIDDITAAPFATPPLTSIRLNVDREGYLIAKAVADTLGRDFHIEPPEDSPPFTLIRRESA